jgi:phosphatidylserine/phosphatidylglycerophosphate/cardiolipin synthase-like enzyme
METYSKDNKISLGRGKGMEILKAIKNAKSSVKIVSPYLSPDYIKELIKLHNKNVQITLITCDNLETNRWSDFKHSDIINRTKIENTKSRKLKKKLLVISLIFLLISIISFFLSVILPILLYLSVFLIVVMLLVLAFVYILKDDSYEYHPIFRLKVFDSKSGINSQSTNLIHSKIFLIDENVLFLGSANFTYSAFNTHYETVMQIQDTQAIADISNEIENLFNSRDLREKTFEELFRE